MLSPHPHHHADDGAGAHRLIAAPDGVALGDDFTVVARAVHRHDAMYDQSPQRARLLAALALTKSPHAQRRLKSTSTWSPGRKAGVMLAP